MSHRRREVLQQPWQTQCECEVTVSDSGICSCTDWFTVPAGMRRPDVPVCPQCLAGKHKD
jgi:hypothetical protein